MRPIINVDFVLGYFSLSDNVNTIDIVPFKALSDVIDLIVPVILDARRLKDIKIDIGLHQFFHIDAIILCCVESFDLGRNDPFQFYRWLILIRHIMEF